MFDESGPAHIIHVQQVGPLILYMYHDSQFN